MPYYVFSKCLFEGSFDSTIEAQAAFAEATGLDPLHPDISTTSYAELDPVKWFSFIESIKL